MAEKPDGGGKKGSNVGKAALLLGAAGLLLFIVGVKRRYRIDEEREIGSPPPRGREKRPQEGEAEEDDAE